MITLILLTNLYIALFYGFYWLTIRKTTFFQVNRFYLLSSIPLAYFCGFIAISQSIQGYFAQPVIMDWVSTTQLATINIGVSENTDSTVKLPADTGFSMAMLLYSLKIVYLLGVVMAFGGFIIRFVRTVRSIQASTPKQAQSFFNWIKVDVNLNGYDQIRKHEEIHVKQKHSYDIIFIELAIVFNWFNPFLYLIRKNLKFQHEFIADEIASNTDKISYAELLLANTFEIQPLLLNNKFHNPSLLKSRIMMLLKNKTSKKHLGKLIAVLPLMLGMVLLSGTISSCNNNTKSEEASLESENSEINESNLPQEDVNTNSLLSTEKQQNTDSTLENIPPPVVFYDHVEVRPIPSNEHYNSITEFRAWIANNFVVPQKAIEAGVKGLVEVRFIIEVDGSISHVEIVKDLGYGVGAALKKLVENSYAWKPGIHNGKPLRTNFRLPLDIDTTM